MPEQPEGLLPYILVAAMFTIPLIALLVLLRRERRNPTLSAVASLLGPLDEEVRHVVVREHYSGMCPACGSTNPGVLSVEYRRISFLRVLGFTSEKRFYRACPRCGQEQEIDKSVLELQQIRG